MILDPGVDDCESGKHDDEYPNSGVSLHQVFGHSRVVVVVED